MLKTIGFLVLIEILFACSFFKSTELIAAGIIFFLVLYVYCYLILKILNKPTIENRRFQW